MVGQRPPPKNGKGYSGYQGWAINSFLQGTTLEKTVVLEGHTNNVKISCYYAILHTPPSPPHRKQRPMLWVDVAKCLGPLHTLHLL